MTVALSCHCGRVRFQVPAAPTEIGQCNCSICSKLGWRLGYYVAEDVTRLSPEAHEDSYRRADIDPICLEVRRCRVCGVATHWQPVPLKPGAKWGVNAALMEGVDLASIPVRRIDGASW
jgi:hypothetical protein